MNSYRDLIDRYGSIGNFANAIGVEYVTAQMMRYRDSISSDYFEAIVGSAAERGFEDVTMSKLHAMRKARRERGSLGFPPAQRAETHSAA